MFGNVSSKDLNLETHSWKSLILSFLTGLEKKKKLFSFLRYLKFSPNYFVYVRKQIDQKAIDDLNVLTS